jgi:hypothetical protein
MRQKWLSPPALSRLLEDHYPLNAAQVRAWCEEGLIPPEFVRRSLSAREREHWRIAARGLETILHGILGLSAREIAEVRARLEGPGARCAPRPNPVPREGDRG